MDDTTAKIKTIVIQFNNPPPPDTVSLPIIARPSRVWNVFNALFLVVAGVPGVLVPIPMFVMLPLFVWEMTLTWSPKYILMVLVLVLASPFSVLLGAFFFAGLTCLWDAVRSDPVLEISADGLRDHRSRLSVPWSSVRCGQLLRESVGHSRSVDLTLDRAVVKWQNPFRLGVLGVRFRPKPNHVIVPVSDLDVREEILIHAVMMLVQWHGGQAFNAPTFASWGRRNPPKPFPTVRRTPSGLYLEYAQRGVSQK